MVVDAMTFATPATAQGVPAKTPTPSTELKPIDKGAQTKGVSEPIPIPVETFTP